MEETYKIMNYAYVTICTSKEYIIGVYILYKSIIDTGTNIPFVCLIPDDFNEDITILINTSMKIVRSSNIKFNESKIANGVSAWNNTFFKFRIFELVDYNKCVFLDSDMIVLKNIDVLFSYPHMSAVKNDYQFIAKPWNGELNSGLLVFEPNKDICKKLIGMAPNIINLCISQNKGVGDQDVINFMFSDWHLHNELHISEIYNCAINMITKQHWMHLVDYSVKDIAIVHFVGPFKPWQGALKYAINRLLKLKFPESMIYLKYWRYLHAIKNK